MTCISSSFISGSVHLPWIETAMGMATATGTHCRGFPAVSGRAFLELPAGWYNQVVATEGVKIEVVARPATFATAHEKAWKEAIRAAVTAADIAPRTARWGVRLEF